MTDDGAVYVGLMSGTSLDGISAAVVYLADDGARVTSRLLGFTLTEYTAQQRERLAAAMRGVDPDEYCQLNFAVGEWLASAALAAMHAAGVTSRDVRAVASHGQTLWHVPGHSTWQTGESAVIAERTCVDVVSDFRVRDVAAGGQGAPLVPIADSLLYSHADEWRLLQNIGGMANVTVVPPGGDVSEVVAFDTGPGMAVIDAVVRAQYPDLRYDEGGRIARDGTVRESVVTRLLGDQYFTMQPPKSTGREHFGDDYARTLIDLCMKDGGSAADAVATAVALTVRSIADAYRSFAPALARDVIVSGGGTRNITLMNVLREAIAPRRLLVFDDLYYDAEAKEAVAFALLAHLHLARQPGNISGATGARARRVLGKLTPA
jgi:anhydro-N-acetylmuramic acid kinase